MAVTETAYLLRCREAGPLCGKVFPAQHRVGSGRREDGVFVASVASLSTINSVSGSATSGSCVIAGETDGTS